MPSSPAGTTSIDSGASNGSISRSLPGLPDASTSFFTASFYGRLKPYFFNVYSASQ